MFFGNNFQKLEIVLVRLAAGGIYFASALIEPRVGRMLKPRECAGQKPNYEAVEYAMPARVWQRGLTNNAAG